MKMMRIDTNAAREIYRNMSDAMFNLMWSGDENSECYKALERAVEALDEQFGFGGDEEDERKQNG